MGFGSYDEREEAQRTPEIGEIDDQPITRTGFDGELTFESGADTDDLLATLGRITGKRDPQG